MKPNCSNPMASWVLESRRVITLSWPLFFVNNYKSLWSSIWPIHFYNFLLSFLDNVYMTLMLGTFCCKEVSTVRAARAEDYERIQAYLENTNEEGNWGRHHGSLLVHRKPFKACDVGHRTFIRYQPGHCRPYHETQNWECSWIGNMQFKETVNSVRITTSNAQHNIITCPFNISSHYL